MNNEPLSTQGTERKASQGSRWKVSGERIRKMNVSAAADAEFLRLLEKEDPRRYANLMRNMRRSIKTSHLRSEIEEHKQTPFTPATPSKGGRPRKYTSDRARKLADAERKRQTRSRVRKTYPQVVDPMTAADAKIELSTNTPSAPSL